MHFLNLIFNWMKIVLQCCIGFCHTTVQISHNYIQIPSLLCLPPLHPIPPLQVITEHQAGLLVLYSNFPLVIYFTHDSVYIRVCQCCVLSLPNPLLLPLCAQVHSLHLHSFPANRNHAFLYLLFNLFIHQVSIH